jgi:hypothetical protein
LIIDNVDKFDKPSRKGLLIALMRYKIPALVAITCTKEEIVMKSGSLDGLNGYWIENGKAEKI